MLVETVVVTSDIFWSFLTYILTISDGFYPITSDVWGLFWTPIPTLKSDIIYGRSLSWEHLKNQEQIEIKSG